MRLKRIMEQFTSSSSLKIIAKNIDVFDTTKSSLEHLREILEKSLSDHNTVEGLWASLKMREKFAFLSLLENCGSKPVETNHAFEVFQAYSNKIHQEANQEDSFKNISPQIISAYKSGILTALKDERLTSDERAILDAFRQGLGLSHRQEMYLFAQLGLFKDITSSDLNDDILKTVRKNGLMFKIGTGRKKEFSPSYVIPYEVLCAIRSVEKTGVSKQNYVKYLSRIPESIMKRIYQYADLKKTAGVKRMIKKIVHSGYSLADVLRPLDTNELRAICYANGFRPIKSSKAQLLINMSEFADITDDEDFPTEVLLSEADNVEKVTKILKCWRETNSESLETVLKNFLITPSTHMQTLASRVINSGVPLMDLLGHPTVNSSVVKAIVGRLAYKMMPRKSDNLKRINVFLNDVERDLTPYIQSIAQRDVMSLGKNGLAYTNDEIPELYERVTHYIFDNYFEFDVRRHPLLVSKDGKQLKPDGAINLDGKRVILWDNKVCKSKYSFTTKGPRPHFNQFKDYIEAFRNTYPKKQLLSFMIVTSRYSEDVPQKLRRLKEATNCDVCILSSMNLELLNELSPKASNDARKDINLFNFTGEISESRIRNRESS